MISQLKKLKKSLSDLSYEDQLKLHEAIRMSRRIPKRLTPKKKATSTTNTNRMDKLVDKLSGQELTELIERLEKDATDK